MPALPPEFEIAPSRAEAAITHALADLPPDKRDEKLLEMVAALTESFERDFVSEDEQKAQLRRLDCTADLNNPVEFWRWLWAAAHNAGFTEAQFWRLSPRDLYAVLELKAAEIERASGPRIRARKRASVSGRQETKEKRALRRRAVITPILEKKEWTRGKLCTESAVGKATVYGFLDGSRKTISTPNRNALADVLGMARKDFPV